MLVSTGASQLMFICWQPCSFICLPTWLLVASRSNSDFSSFQLSFQFMKFYIFASHLILTTPQISLCIHLLIIFSNPWVMTLTLKQSDLVFHNKLWFPNKNFNVNKFCFKSALYFFFVSLPNPDSNSSFVQFQKTLQIIYISPNHILDSTFHSAILFVYTFGFTYIRSSALNDIQLTKQSTARISHCLHFQYDL